MNSKQKMFYTLKAVPSTTTPAPIDQIRFCSRERFLAQLNKLLITTVSLFFLSIPSYTFCSLLLCRTPAKALGHRHAETNRSLFLLMIHMMMPESLLEFGTVRIPFSYVELTF